jgi:hypothetical protein
MEFLGGIGMAAALWYGSREIAMGRLTAGEFTSFVAALLLTYGPVKKLSRVNANLQQAVAASERLHARGRLDRMSIWFGEPSVDWANSRCDGTAIRALGREA